MLRTQIYLPERQVKILKKKANDEGVSVSEVIRRAVDKQVVNKKIQSPKKEGNVGKWLQMVAREVSFKGPRDLAKNMDKYLYDKDFR